MPYGDIKLRQLESTDARLARLNGELREASAQTILRVAMVREWPEQLTYVSSFGAESVAMLSLIAEVDPSLPVVFLDTGMHFPQTLDYRDEVIERLGLTGVRSIPPNETERKVLDPDNKLWQSEPDACCALRKVRPLEPALEGFDAWITGRKRYQGADRTALPAIEGINNKIKINPLAGWSQQRTEGAFHGPRGLPRGLRQGRPGNLRAA